jgi:hypothetical protein
MRDAFIDYLSTHSPLSAESFNRLRPALRNAPEPIGSIAFKYGLINTGDIDLILDEQRKNHRQFGVIAIQMGILTRAQLDALLRVQQMRYSVEIAEALALSGLQPVEEIMVHLGEFLSKSTNLQAV